MTLEEKILNLSPGMRVQVEDYVDFLLSRMDAEPAIPAPSLECNKTMEKAEDENILSLSSPGSSPLSDRIKKNSSGIILAEETLSDAKNPDYVDFADINSRFGHTPKREEEKKEQGRLRRLLDWM
ncbi:MAG: hypothetical protein GXY48_06950 [Methanomicrobiales archaeon]|nr:hypothetical protein [Methanomicrobiales archaeon]